MQLVPVAPEIAFAQARWDSLKDHERGLRILAVIHEKGSTKSELADHLNVSFQAVHAWVMGDSSADWARWMAVCLALGISQTWEPSKAVLAKAHAEVAELRARSAKAKRSTHRGRPQ